MRLVSLLAVASIIGGVQWYLYDRPVRHASGALAPDEPVIATSSSAPAWADPHGFRYKPLARMNGRVVVVARRNYSLGEFAHLAPTDLAIVWGPLSAPEAYSQVKWDQRGSPLLGRFVGPDIRPDSALAQMPRDQVQAYMLANLTHVHTIPADKKIANRLAGIRPGQVIQFSGVLVEAIGPSGASYRSSLALHDYDCEIAWVDELELVD